MEVDMIWSSLLEDRNRDCLYSCPLMTYVSMHTKALIDVCL